MKLEPLVKIILTGRKASYWSSWTYADVAAQQGLTGVYFAVACEFVLESFALTACLCFIQLKRGPPLSSFYSLFGGCMLTKDSFCTILHAF